jgi:rubrerythrin
MTAPFDEKQERMLVLFKLAIDSERDAQKMYAEMLLNCEDPALAEVIEYLRAAEEAHEEILLSKYASLRNDGEDGG